jgi:signal transduction histidine kinase
MGGGRSADLKRVIINLLENAIQYTEKGTVSLHVARHGGRVELEVVDSGIGIAEAELPLVFDRFWRSDKARTHRTGGNGLGLAIAKAVVEAHGGNIAVRGGANRKGTVFSFVLPVSQQDSQQNQHQGSRPEA